MKHRHRRPKSWRRLDDPNQLPKIIFGVRFTDGIEVVVDKTHIVQYVMSCRVVGLGLEIAILGAIN
jgi:hypothetical protein